jgi:hypothetical protein
MLPSRARKVVGGPWTAVACSGSGSSCSRSVGRSRSRTPRRCRRNGDPAVLTFAAPQASFVPTGTSGQFRISVPDVFPNAGYSERPRRRGIRVPFPWGLPLVDSEGIEALIRLPERAKGQDAVAVELTETTYSDEAGYSTLATVIDDFENPLLGRMARGLDASLPASAEHTEISLPDPDGGMEDVVRSAARTQSSDSVIGNTIFTPSIPGLVRVIPTGSRCAKDQRALTWDGFNDNWVTWPAFTVDTSAGCFFEESDAEWDIVGDGFNLHFRVAQKYPSREFTVTSCSGSLGSCAGSNGDNQFTINVFRASGR